MFAVTLLDPAAVALPQSATVTDRALASTVAQAVQEFCILVRLPGAQEEALVDAILGLPLDLQLLWTEIVKSRLLLDGIEGLSNHFTSFCSAGCPPMLNSLSIELIVSSMSQSATHACTACGAEYVSYQDLPRSTATRRANGLRQSSLGRGLDRKVEMDRRFGALAQMSTQGAVLDRYACAALHRDAGAGNTGIEWFLNELLVREVDDIFIVAAYGMTVGGVKITEPMAVNLLGDMMNRLRGTHGRRITATARVVTDRTFGRHSHDRFVRLTLAGSPVTATLGKGPDCFQERTFSQNYAFAWQDNDAIHDFMATISGVPGRIVRI